MEQVLARWDFSPDDPVVAQAPRPARGTQVEAGHGYHRQAKEHLTAAVAAEERLRTAIASKKVRGHALRRPRKEAAISVERKRRQVRTTESPATAFSAVSLAESA